MSITQLERRVIEAQAVLGVFRELVPRLGREQALVVVTEASQTAARAAGADLAARVAQLGESETPSLAHFASVLKNWRAGGALDITEERLEGNRLSFCVTRCGYVEAYRELGIDGELAFALSCARDGCLAQGYSPHLRMERSPTIAQGAPACLFSFYWD